MEMKIPKDAGTLIWHFLSGVTLGLFKKLADEMLSYSLGETRGKARVKISEIVSAGGQKRAGPLAGPVYYSRFRGGR